MGKDAECFCSLPRFLCSFLNVNTGKDYSGIKNYLYDIFGKNINLVDGNKGISFNLKKILTENNLLNSENNKQSIIFHTSGNKDDFEKLNRFFELSKTL